ncbi:MAG: anthranilate synthase component I family protein [Elusimicrobia bacterium]|nr:anthranilate synthase component I family protein [Elusimicrobiota bacterium]
MQQALRPVVRELSGDLLTPVGAYLRLRGRGPSFLLESGASAGGAARWSFAGAGPIEALRVEAGVATATDAGGTRALPGNPFQALGRRLEAWRATAVPGLPPFAGGAVGWVGYEMARHLEPATGLAAPPGPEALLWIFPEVVAFDHASSRLYLVSNGGSRRSLDALAVRLARPLPRAARRPAGSGRVRPLLGREAFVDGVRSLKAGIRAGDIFQAVLSAPFESETAVDPASVYRALRRLNPSPYLFLLEDGAQAWLGASPETLVRCEAGRLETRPIAGTRPRGAGPEEDAQRQRDLCASVKEGAEHLMLVDLGRNDLGRVAAPGSVRVAAFRSVERYSHVMHLVSIVTGRLAAGKTAWDALAACFPAGTVSGAPKIRAMSLLGALEAEPRGFYAGAVVYHDFHGNLDSAIAIRSLRMRRSGGRWVVRAQAGAGVVADSRPEAEWDEVNAKAAAALAAVRLAETGPKS